MKIKIKNTGSLVKTLWVRRRSCNGTGSCAPLLFEYSALSTSSYDPAHCASKATFHVYHPLAYECLSCCLVIIFPNVRAV